MVHILGAVQILAGRAVQHIDVAVAVGLGQGFDLLPAALDREQEQVGVAVVVPDVVRRELEVPLHLARIRVQGQHRVGVQVVALAHVAVPVRRGVARRPVEQVGLRVVRAGHPGRGAAVLPGVARPGFRPGLAGLRDGVAPPFARARLDVVGVDVAADAVLAAGDADDQVVADHQRGSGPAEPVGVAVHDRLPHHGSGLAVECHHLRVQGGHENFIPGNGRTFVRRPAAHAQVVRQRVFVAPQEGARHRVQGEQVVVRRGEIDDAVRHDGRGLELGRNAGLEHPSRGQVLDVAAVDVVQRAEAPAGVVAAVHQPVGRVVGAVQQVLLSDRLKVVSVGGRGAVGLHVRVGRGGRRRWRGFGSVRCAPPHGRHRGREPRRGCDDAGDQSGPE